MLISYKHKFIFIHIFKTAGTSISARLAPHSRFIDSLVYGHWSTRKFFIALNILFNRKSTEFLTGFNPHATAMEAKTKLAANIYDVFFKFAFVRNPWDLHVSLYFYLCKNKKHPLSKTVRAKNFAEFIEWYIGTDPKSQLDFVSDPFGGIIVDFIGKFENVSNDYDYIKTKLGLNSPPLPMINVSDNRSTSDYRSYYNDKTYELVARYFKKDIEKFNYKFK